MIRTEDISKISVEGERETDLLGGIEDTCKVQTEEEKQTK